MALAAFALTQTAHGQVFVWKAGVIRIGTLNVPTGFKVENYDYREGIVTTLLYENAHESHSSLAACTACPCLRVRTTF